MAKTKDWYAINLKTFEKWALRIDAPWPAIKAHLHDLISKARKHWPEQIKRLPMYENHKQQLISHWQRLHEDFKIMN